MIDLDQQIEGCVTAMTQEQREHFKEVIAALAGCYAYKDMHALVIIGQDEGVELDLTSMIAVNLTDIQAMKLTSQAAVRVGSVLMAEAPPRELFN